MVTQPTQIIDKNGKQNTVHKGRTKLPTNGRDLASITPVAPVVLDFNQSYTHNTIFDGDDRNVPMVVTGAHVAPADAPNWHIATEGETAINKVYWETMDEYTDLTDVETRELAQIAANRTIRFLEEAAAEQARAAEDSKNDRSPLDTTSLRMAVNDIPYPDSKDKTERAALRRERDENIAILEKRWQTWLQDEYAYDLPASAHEHIYRKAWADGHASGYAEVEMHYQDLAGMVTKIIKGE